MPRWEAMLLDESERVVVRLRDWGCSRSGCVTLTGSIATRSRRSSSTPTASSNRRGGRRRSAGGDAPSVADTLGVVARRFASERTRRTGARSPRGSGEQVVGEAPELIDGLGGVRAERSQLGLESGSKP